MKWPVNMMQSMEAIHTMCRSAQFGHILSVEVITQTQGDDYALARN